MDSKKWGGIDGIIGPDVSALNLGEPRCILGDCYFIELILNSDWFVFIRDQKQYRVIIFISIYYKLLIH